MQDQEIAYQVSFFDPGYAPVTVNQSEKLFEVMDATNSPLLFGCRTGICGTCLIEVEGELAPAAVDEQELLDVLAPGNPKARLACQIELSAPIKVRPLNFA